MRLIGIPILLVGLALLAFNAPYSNWYYRMQGRLRLPFAYRSVGIVRVLALVIGIGWALGGVLILIGALRPS